MRTSRAGDEEFVGAELEHDAAADRARGVGVGPGLDPGPVALAELPEAELGGDPPAAHHVRLVGAVVALGDAPGRVRRRRAAPSRAAIGANRR